MALPLAAGTFQPSRTPPPLQKMIKKHERGLVDADRLAAAGALVVDVSEKFWVVVTPAVTVTVPTVDDVKPDLDAVTLRFAPGVTLAMV